MKSLWEKKTMSSRRNSNSIPKINLEKKTSEKIAAMTNNVLTMDFVLKNRKLLNKIKKCRVKINKMKNKLGNKNRIPNSKKIAQKSEKHMNPKRSTPMSVKENIISSAKERSESAMSELKETEEEESSKGVNSETSKTPEEISKKSAKSEPKEQEESEKYSEDENRSITAEIKERNPRSASKKKAITPDSSPRLNNRRKMASPAIKEVSEDPPAKRQRPTRNAQKLLPILDIFLDEPKTSIKDDKPKRQIFIRLPFNEISRLNGKKSKAQNRISKINLKKLGKTYLTEKFGGRYFRSHVKLLRFYDPQKPRPQKKTKNNRKSVSFVETVEVFGESENEDESESENDFEECAPIEDKDASEETNKESAGNNTKEKDVNGTDFDSEDDVPLTPRKEDKFSALKAIDVLSPKSKEKRRSAEENSKNSSDEDNTPIINSVKRKVDTISSSVLTEDSSSDSVELQEIEAKNVNKNEKDKQNENDKDEHKNRSRSIEISEDDSEDERNSKEDNAVRDVSSKEDQDEDRLAITSTDDESNDKDKDNEKNKNDDKSTKSPINGKRQVQSEDDDIFSDADDFFNDKMQVSDTPKQNQKQKDETVTGSSDKTKPTENN